MASKAGSLSEAATFLRQLWAKMESDDVLFMASGVAFNILLAGVPFFLLLASGLGYALGTSPDASNGAVADFIRDLFPLNSDGAESVLDPVIRDVARTRGAAGLFGAVTFVWFSTRLFGSLRAVFNTVFGVPRGQGILLGKVFDVWFTIAATGLVVVWIAASASVAVARTRGAELLASVGVEGGSVVHALMYTAGRLVAFALLVTVFFALYKALPYRRVRWQQALFGAVTSAVLFEIARWAFTLIVHRLDPGTIYTGALAAIIIVVFWVYYGALIVIVGGEASQVHERSRTAKLNSK